MDREVLEQIQTERLVLVKKREALIKSFTTAANGGKQKRMSTLFVRICQTNQFLASLEQIANSKPELTSGKRRYAVSSLFLHESFKKLTAGRRLWNFSKKEIGVWIEAL